MRRFWRIDSLSWGWGLVPLGGEAADDLESGRVSGGVILWRKSGRAMVSIVYQNSNGFKEVVW